MLCGLAIIVLCIAMLQIGGTSSSSEVYSLETESMPPSQAGVSIPEAIDDRKSINDRKASRIIEDSGTKKLPRVKIYSTDPAAPTWSGGLERKYLWEAIMVLQGSEYCHTSQSVPHK